MILLAAAGTAACTTVVVGALAVLVGPAAALGAAVGGGVTLVVFALGAWAVYVVSGLMPAMSMLAALMTYTLQLVVLVAVVAWLESSGLADQHLSRGWFAAGVIAVTVVWLALQVWLLTRLRIPAYDLSRGGGPGGER